jgi:hypothetical protein
MYPAEQGLRRAILRLERRLEQLQWGDIADRIETGVSRQQEIANVKNYIEITHTALKKLQETA